MIAVIISNGAYKIDEYYNSIVNCPFLPENFSKAMLGKDSMGNAILDEDGNFNFYYKGQFGIFMQNYN